MRTIDPEHNWFWQEGHRDAMFGLRATVPDEARHSFQRSDYFAGYRAGEEDADARDDLLIEGRETRLVNCETCRTEGVIERGHPNAPDPASVEICSACKGERVIEVEVETITEEDI